MDDATRLRSWVDCLGASLSGYEPPSGFDADTVRRELVGGADDPLVARYCHQAREASTAGRPHRNNEAWQALAERNQSAVVLASVPVLDNLSCPWDEYWPDASAFLALLISQATPYLWRGEVHDVARAAPLPAHTIARDCLPMPLMFWSYEAALGEASDPETTNWMLLAEGNQGFVFCHDVVRDSSGTIEYSGGIIPYQSVWPSREQPESDAAVAEILKLCAFLRAPFIDAEPQRLPRPIRREMARAGLPDERQTETASVVQLRRAVTETHGAAHGDGVNWKHQWWVSGHFRAQWYPSQQAHKIIAIAPHLKGPADAPVLEKIYDVAR